MRVVAVSVLPSIRPEAARRSEDDSVDHGPADRGQRDPPEPLPAGRPEGGGGLLLLVAQLAQGRDDLAGDERHGHEDGREHNRRQGEQDLEPVREQPAAEPAAARRVEQIETEADDDGRHRQRKVDEGVQQPLAAKAATHDRERAKHAEDCVERDGNGRRDQRHLEGVDRVGVGERLPDRLEPVLERAVEDHRERREQDDQQVTECHRAQSEPPRHARAS